MFAVNPSGFGSGGSFGGSHGTQGGMQGGSGMGTHGSSQQRSHAGRGPKGWKRSDERIRDDVSEQLERHHEIDASDIEVRVENGEVTLTGSVEDRRAKRMAEDIAESVPGVSEVQNQIRVKRESRGSEHSQGGGSSHQGGQSGSQFGSHSGQHGGSQGSGGQQAGGSSGSGAGGTSAGTSGTMAGAGAGVGAGAGEAGTGAGAGGSSGGATSSGGQTADQGQGGGESRSRKGS